MNIIHRIRCWFGAHSPSHERHFARDGQDRLILALQCTRCGTVLHAVVASGSPTSGRGDK